MSETERGTCAECGTEHLVNKDGTVRKHGDCPGGGQPPAKPDDRAPDPAPQGDSVASPDGMSEPAGPENTGGDQEPDTAKTAAGQPPAQDLGYGRGAYAWDLTVSQPALYLGDPAWQRANGQMAEQHARDAGHTVTGEAQCTAVATTEDGTGVTLTYLVPIETED